MMAANTENTAVTWTVNSTLRTPDPTNPQPGQWVYEVSFTTGSGASGVVNIPEARIGDQAYVRSVIHALAAQLDAVRTMTSQAG